MLKDNNHLASSSKNPRKNDDDYYSDNGCSENSGSDDLSTAQTSISAGARRSEGIGENVILWRVIVISLLVLNGSIAGVTYLYSLITRDNHVQTQFYMFSQQIARKSIENSNELHGDFRIFTNHVQSAASTKETKNDANWPFHSQKNFLKLSNNLLKEDGFQLIALAPLVTDETRSMWETYSVKNQDWINEKSTDREEGKKEVNTNNTNSRRLLGMMNNESSSLTTLIRPNIYRRGHNGQPFIEYTSGPFAPLWQYNLGNTINNDNSSSSMKRNVNPALINFNLLSVPSFSNIFYQVLENRRGILSDKISDLPRLFGNIDDESTTLSNNENQVNDKQSQTHPRSIVAQPIFGNYSNNADIVATMIAVLPWNVIFENILPVEVEGLICVVQNNVGESTFTYQINGRNAIFLGPGDLHDDEFDYLDQTFDFDLFDEHHDGEEHRDGDSSTRTLRIYPSERFYEVYKSNTPSLFAGYLVLIFLATCAIFAVYERVARGIEKKIHKRSKQSDMILSTLYPQEIRDQVLEQQSGDNTALLKMFESDKARLHNFLSGEDDSKNAKNSKPIANLFPNSSVLYADMAGFTAWSSVREPEAVFTLLETVYCSFDAVARRRKVFKVETIGDCYVAATGLPKAQPDHAIIMVKFARDCIRVMNESIAKLELALGPGTAELAMRIGIHSGPVTAGVLRGEKSRFQLFGETVNIASRVETAGVKNRIHISQETADLLAASGKSSWVIPRENKVAILGTDLTQTFWVISSDRKQSLTSGSGSSENLYEFQDTGSSRPTNEPTSNEMFGTNTDVLQESKDNDKVSNEFLSSRRRGSKIIPTEKMGRLIQWNVDSLKKILTEVVANRDAEAEKEKTGNQMKMLRIGSDETVNELDQRVIHQLGEYVKAIAALHENYPFHNFEHTSHVSMSMNRLLGRLVPNVKGENHNGASSAICPLTRFALVFSALNHDVGHSGSTDYHKLAVHNVTQNDDGRKPLSVSGQNSFGVVWNLFMEDRFQELRKCICRDRSELRQFQQLVMSSSNAVNIADAEQLNRRKKRWSEVFSAATDTASSTKMVGTSGRAAVVTENIVLASYFAHTMQNWNVYKKWNDQLLSELQLAYENSEIDEDPSIGWYLRELQFFDCLVIPLAENLSHCGNGGNISNEYLDYAIGNRRELSLLNSGKDDLATDTK